MNSIVRRLILVLVPALIALQVAISGAAAACGADPLGGEGAMIVNLVALAASLIVSVVRDGHETVLVDCSAEEPEANGENVFRHEERLELMDSETFVLEARWRAAPVPELRRRLLKQFADAAAGRFQLREL